MIWVASYCKGTMITAVIFLVGSMLFKIGSKNEMVLPVPVGAVTIRFLFYKRQGKTCICTAVGLSNPNYPRPWIS